jgi:multisite-specific tRNA:(cytosine-C5)-methyltransferase
VTSREHIILKDRREKLEEDFGTDKVSSKENDVHQQVVDDANVPDGEQNGGMVSRIHFPFKVIS